MAGLDPAILFPFASAMKEKRIHQVFEVSLALKGLHALVECAGGMALAFTRADYLRALASRLTQHELSEDPRDLVANYLLHAAQEFSVSTAQFYSFYLLSHGLIKLFLTVSLLKNRLWAYPVSMAALGLFIVYQIYRFSFTHSLFLIALSVFDVFMIGLIWHEYKISRQMER